MFSFEIRQRDGLARICSFVTPHGKVETPTLLPVINPNQMIVTPAEMKKLFGTQMIITNSYIIKKTPELRNRAETEGLHSLMDFHGPIMTDSGTFQMHVYGRVETTSDEIVAFQNKIGSDVGTILDIFSEPEHPRERVEEDMEETLKRASSASEYAGKMGLAIPVQGGLFMDMRGKCAQEVSKVNAAVHPIGGVVPLMEDYRYEELANIIIHSKKGLRSDRPVHLFGCGHPMLFPLAVLLGCDMFDSASYAKYARDGRMMFSWGTRHLKEMEELPCNCLVCRENTVDRLLALRDEERMRALALHNLSVSFEELKRIKQALREGRLWESVCQRARSHPRLLEAMSSVKIHAPWIEGYTPSTRPKGMMYTGLETLWRPEVYHALDKLFSEELYNRDSYMLIPFMGGKSLDWSRENLGKLVELWKEHGVLVDSIFGPVPLELLESYPFGGIILPYFSNEWESGFYPLVDERRKKLLARLAVWDKGIELFEMESFSAEDETLDEALQQSFDSARIRMLCTYQFFSGSAGIILDGKVKFLRSKNTGKIRNVLCDGDHVLSLRAEDGMFSLKIPGARRMCQKEQGTKVVVDSESGEFNRQGKNVMSKFIIGASEDMNPMDEVYVVDENNTLLAVGRALLTADEMQDFSRGVAVKVREGVDSPDDDAE